MPPVTIIARRQKGHHARLRRAAVCRRAAGRVGDHLAVHPGCALQARTRRDDTTLTGPIADQAALYGVLAEIEALGLELLEVRRLPRR
jgi:hypothetical protein